MNATAWKALFPLVRGAAYGHAAHLTSDQCSQVLTYIAALETERERLPQYRAAVCACAASHCAACTQVVREATAGWEESEPAVSAFDGRRAG